MFLEDSARGHGEPSREPKRLTSVYSKGYPAVRDPAAENPQGAMPRELGTGELHRLRQHYGPALVR